MQLYLLKSIVLVITFSHVIIFGQFYYVFLEGLISVTMQLMQLLLSLRGFFPGSRSLHIIWLRTNKV